MATTSKPKAVADRSYWSNNGRHQAEYERLRVLVPKEGPAPTPAGEIVRCLSNVYYDIYNNGGCNLHLPRLAAQWDYLRGWSGALGVTQAPPEFAAVDAALMRQRRDGDYLPSNDEWGDDDDAEPSQAFPYADLEVVADAFILLAVKLKPGRPPKDSPARPAKSKRKEKS